MKYITTLILGLLIIPSVSSASALTQSQANSLIVVVQSSTSTPASAFVPLITTFSNITVPQAESLINVVQQSPETPASAFTDMLMAFTVDPIISTPVVQSTQTPITPTFGSVSQATTPQTTQPVQPVQPTQTFGAVTPSPCDDTPTITITPFLANPASPNNLNDIADRVILSEPVTISSVINSQGERYWPFVYFSVSAESACHSSMSWVVNEQYTSPNGMLIQPITNDPSATYPTWNGSMSVNGIAGASSVTFTVTDFETTATTTETINAI